MDIEQLRVFVAVVEEGGLSAAARRLHLSQPTLSQTIQALEKQLDVQLLRRSNVGVTPTAAGLTLLKEARAVIARYEQALSAMTAHTTDGRRSLRLGVPMEMPAEPLSGALASMASAYPQSVVEVRHMSTAAQIRALRNGDLDFGLVRERPTDESLDASLVFAEPLGVLVSDEDARALDFADGPIRLDRLARMQWLGFPREGSPAWYDEVTSILRSHGVDPGSVQSHTQDLIPEVKLAAVSATGKFTLAPANWHRTLPSSVHWYALEGDPLIRRTWVVWPAASRRRDIGHLVAALEEAVIAAASRPS
ncbi:LysR family transcriptional regulator [Mycobacterium sp. IEC1808]|uniref:LysR substrate-binding domain-containing protein n=1 Tax=Mycobacterium sp. IEC1808 TaxID=1743230 RepID=UPI000A15B9CC|nr:LysR family transcriptional regulator [Mycobacterium sp. IEC1808]